MGAISLSLFVGWSGSYLLADLLTAFDEEFPDVKGFLHCGMNLFKIIRWINLNNLTVKFIAYGFDHNLSNSYVNPSKLK